MCTFDSNDDFTMEIDSEVFNKDFDEAYPGEEIQNEETDIQFE